MLCQVLKRQTVMALDSSKLANSVLVEFFTEFFIRSIVILSICLTCFNHHRSIRQFFHIFQYFLYIFRVARRASPSSTGCSTTRPHATSRPTSWRLLHDVTSPALQVTDATCVTTHQRHTQEPAVPSENSSWWYKCCSWVWFDVTTLTLGFAYDADWRHSYGTYTTW